MLHYDMLERYHHPMFNHFEDCKAKVTLKNKDLWNQFHQLGTEMIITKGGRRMFPTLHIDIKDLDPKSYYRIYLEMVPASNCRYKYSTSGGWAPAGTEEAQSPHRMYVHPEVRATGDYWMSQPVSFGRVKLTNTPSAPAGHVVLSSMHKYQPRIIIEKEPNHFSGYARKTVEFPETQFIAVTAYQNEKITQLKIYNNPFAKGFRENGRSQCKRKRLQSEEGKVEVDEERTIKKAREESPIIRIKDFFQPAISSPSSSSSSPSSLAPSSPEISRCDSQSPVSSANSSYTTYPVFPQNFQNPYNYPQYMHPHMYYYYQNVSPLLPESYYKPTLSPAPVDLTLTIPKPISPTKVTDFSIKSILGS